MHRCTVHGWKVNICGYCSLNSNRILQNAWKKKKKKKKKQKTKTKRRRRRNFQWIQMQPKKERNRKHPFFNYYYFLIGSVGGGYFSSSSSTRHNYGCVWIHWKLRLRLRLVFFFFSCFLETIILVVLLVNQWHDIFWIYYKRNIKIKVTLYDRVFLRTIKNLDLYKTTSSSLLAHFCTKQ